MSIKSRKKHSRKGGNIATAMGCKEGQILASGNACPITSRFGIRYMTTGQCCKSPTSSLFGGNKRKKLRRKTKKKSHKKRKTKKKSHN